MAKLEYIMRKRKITEYKASFKENMGRIGRVYLPIVFLEKMNIENEILIQLATEKSQLAPGGYAAQFIRDKETVSKIRFVEDIAEKGELNSIYISKKVVEHLGIKDELAVRIVPSEWPGGVDVATAAEW